MTRILFQIIIQYFRLMFNVRLNSWQCTCHAHESVASKTGSRSRTYCTLTIKVRSDNEHPLAMDGLKEWAESAAADLERCGNKDKHQEHGRKEIRPAVYEKAKALTAKSLTSSVGAAESSIGCIGGAAASSSGVPAATSVARSHSSSSSESSSRSSRGGSRSRSSCSENKDSDRSKSACASGSS